MTKSVEKAFREIAELAGWELCQQLCEAVVTAPDLLFHRRETTEAEDDQPFITLFSAFSCVCCTCSPYTDLAEIFLMQELAIRRRLAGQLDSSLSDGTAIPQPDDFISLKRFISANTDWPQLMTKLPARLFRSCTGPDKEERLRRGVRKAMERSNQRDDALCKYSLDEPDHPDINEIVWTYFTENKGCFDRAIERTCEAVYQGVPLYRQVDGDFVPAPFTDEDSVYLARKFHHCETSSARDRPFRYPEWAGLYYFKWGDLQAREALFGHWGRGYSDGAVEALRSELWELIGIEERRPVTLKLVKSEDTLQQGKEECERSLEAAEAQIADAMVQFIDQRHWTFVRLISEAALGITHDGETNPFKNDGTDAKVYGDLIRAILARIPTNESESDDATAAPPGNQSEYIPVTDWIVQHFTPRRVYAHELDKCALVNLGHNGGCFYFQKLEQGFADAIWWVCEMVYHGIPLYEMVNGAPRQLPFGHEDYVYLFKKGQHQDWKNDESMFPYWARKYFLKRHHLDKHKVFFAFAAGTPGDAEIAVLRAAFRRDIGLETGASDMGTGKSERFIGTKLRLLIDLWPQVRDILSVDGIDAVYFVEEVFDQRKMTLYLRDDEGTGLWSPHPFTAERLSEVSEKVGRSDYAQGFFGGKAEDPGDLKNYRITPRDFDAILAEARAVASADPDSNTRPSSQARPTISLPYEQEWPPNSQRLIEIANEALKQFNSDGTFGASRCTSIEKGVKNWLASKGLNTREREAIYVLIRPKSGNGSQEAA